MRVPIKPHLLSSTWSLLRPYPIAYHITFIHVYWIGRANRSYKTSQYLHPSWTKQTMTISTSSSSQCPYDKEAHNTNPISVSSISLIWIFCYGSVRNWMSWLPLIYMIRFSCFVTSLVTHNHVIATTESCLVQEGISYSLIVPLTLMALLPHNWKKIIYLL